MNNITAVKMLDILNTGHEGIEYFTSCINRGEINITDMEILNSLKALVQMVETVVEDVRTPHRVKEINSNILYYIEKLKQSIDTENIEVFLYDFRYHLCSLYRILELEIAYIVADFVNKEEYPRLYPEVGVVNHTEIAEQGKNARYKASVVLLAYNNLSYTRDCVESILMNTENVEYELILVDNGSTDGTKEYFDSIPGAKVIYLKYNIHLVKGFNIGMMAAEGKYCAVVCNDFIFTPNWLSNLLICIESDTRIGYVSPGATNISNMQQIHIPFNSKEDFQEKARQYNVSDPAKWEDRVVLLPNVLCCPTALLNRIGYYDTQFFRGEFGDDDISFRIRRAGYRLVYCADTITHHYGSLTTASDHITNSLEEGRQTFVKKYSLDAWFDARMSPIYQNIDYYSLQKVNSILGIDVKCGATLLQIKNHLWGNYGLKPKLTTCTTNPQYKTDLKTISNQVFVRERLHHLSEVINDKFDLIFIEEPLDNYSEELEDIFKNVSELMNNNGHFVFLVNNSISIERIYDLLNGSSRTHNKKMYDHDRLCKQAISFGFQLVSRTSYNAGLNLESKELVLKLANLLAGDNSNNIFEVDKLLSIKYRMIQLRFKTN